MVNRESERDVEVRLKGTPRVRDSRFAIHDCSTSWRHCPPVTGAAIERNLLHGVEIDDGALVIEHRAQFVVTGLRQLPLRLEDQEVDRRARREFALFRLKPALCELT